MTRPFTGFHSPDMCPPRSLLPVPTLAQRMRAEIARAHKLSVARGDDDDWPFLAGYLETALRSFADELETQARRAADEIMERYHVVGEGTDREVREELKRIILGENQR